MTDMLREVSSSIDSLAMGRIAHYLIPLSLVQNILISATAGLTSPIQTHLAFSWGSAITLCVDPEAGDLAFLLSLPIIDSNSIYRLKDIGNVGFWQGNTYVKMMETDGWSTPQHEQLPSHTINTTQPHALSCPTKLYGSLSLSARSSISTS